MKQLAKTLILICLVAVLAFSVVACGSSYKKIEKALINDGYAVVETNDTAEEMEQESKVAVTVHVLSKEDGLNSNVVIVFEFKATDDMMDFYEESKTMQGLVQDIEEDGTAKEFYDALVEKGYANGNCLVMSINPFEAKDVRDIVKNA